MCCHSWPGLSPQVDRASRLLASALRPVPSDPSPHALVFSYPGLPAYYISYGPHGPRAPIVPPNTNGKVFIGVIGCIVTAVGVFALARSRCECPLGRQSRVSGS